MARRPVILIDAPQGQFTPDYRITMFRDGDPARPIRSVDWRSITAIQTAKNITDLSGTFSIALKDKQARNHVREMDAGLIRLRGHYSQHLITVMKVVVDNVRQAGSADVYAASEDTIIEGRCIGKYLQINSLFLPVWDPEANLPTALIFGLGDAAKKVGGNRPYDINEYLIKRFVYGDRKIAGVAGTPNARHWLDYKTRFARDLGFHVPFLQFDENSVAEAFKRLEVLGFTEAWVDELGRQVYRQPGWNHPARYTIRTSALADWAPSRGDVNSATYVEVIPAGDPGIDSATAQALRAGRAPVPSSYLTDGTSIASSVDPGFIIDTDRRGQVTAKGERNHWRRLQRRLGVRPQQITSPLISSQKQAQAQAQGLLEFYARAVKAMTVTIPGAPEVRLGYNSRVEGELEGLTFDRTLYIEAVSHDYVENADGGQYVTHLTLTHGRDAKDPFTGRPDPKWKQITLPKFDPASLASGEGGVLNPGSSDAPLVDGPKARLLPDGTAAAPAGAPLAVKRMIARANIMHVYPYVWGGGHAVVNVPDRGTGRDPGVGFDCSGAAGGVLAAGGKWGSRSVPGSGSFGEFGQAGVGDWVTCYYNGGHVFLVIAGLRFDTSRAGGHAVSPAGTGPRWQPFDGPNYGSFSVMYPEGL